MRCMELSAPDAACQHNACSIACHMAGGVQVGRGISHVVASPSFTFQDWLAMWELAQEGDD